jgi:hypothetical protein
MNSALTVSIVEDATIARLERFGYSFLRGTFTAAYGRAAERTDLKYRIEVGRLRA